MQRMRKRVTDPLLGYIVSFIGVLVFAIPIHFVYQQPPPRNAIVGAVLSCGILVLILGSAWLGYGPGLLVCLLTCFGLPQLMAQANRGVGVNLLQFIALSFISLLVSRVADLSRKRQSDLHRAAMELEERVREGTAEAVRGANAAREQAQLLELAHDAILSLDWNGSIQYWNRGAERMYGWAREQAIGRISHQLLQTAFSEPLSEIERKLANAGYWEGDLQHTRQDGSMLRVHSRWALRHDSDGRPTGFLEINSDITERRKIEEQLRVTQKLESLGVLAGGLAHDFNNLLTGILGNASLALGGMAAHHPDRILIEEVLRAAERAADLTRQLLAYAGKGRFLVRIVDLSALVREISSLVQTSIGRTAQLRLQLADNLPGVEADSGQLQQIVMNLIINGAEAIGAEGGTVLVRTAAQEVDRQYIGTLSSGGEHLNPGLYVMLEVHDTGCGMSEETLARIFDPFFTTKFSGRGLGLSAVQGIVRSHQGALKVYSKAGQGTTFKVLLPAADAPVADVPVRSTGDLAGRGTILIVDDEDIVRRTATQTLTRYGYETVLASDGAEAVELFRKSGSRISLVLLDLTMPVMSGEQTLRELRIIDARVPILLSSGYNEVEAVQRFAGKGLAGFIQKPYTSIALAEKVKEILSS